MVSSKIDYGVVVGDRLAGRTSAAKTNSRPKSDRNGTNGRCAII